jgi:hypothetical protein
MTNQEVLELATLRQRGQADSDEVGVDIRTHHPTLGHQGGYLTVDEAGESVSFHYDDLWFTGTGWESEDNLGLYNEDGDRNEDAEVPEVSAAEFSAWFTGADWKLLN